MVGIVIGIAIAILSASKPKADSDSRMANVDGRTGNQRHGNKIPGSFMGKIAMRE